MMENKDRHRKKWGKAAGIVSFLAVIGAVPLLTFTLKDREFSENENRYLAQKPYFSLEHIKTGEFMQDMEKYVSDQLPLRDSLTTARTELLKAAGSREINGVYLGEDGYLIEQWLEQDFDAEQLQENIESLNRFLEKHQDKKTSVMIVPTAAETMKNKLPAHAPSFCQETAMKQIEDGLSFGTLTDLRQVLAAHREEGVFYRTDHHWTSRGAFLGYLKWCEENEINTPIAQFQKVTVSDSFQGSLDSRVLEAEGSRDSIELFVREQEPSYTVSYNFGKEVSDSVYAPENLDKKDQYQIFLNGNHPEVTIETSNKNGRHLLIIKDSFANALVPFLIGDCESIHLIDLRYYRGSLDDYISQKGINEFLILYNLKNFCEEKHLKFY
jgi:hypothetical protein